MSYDYEEKRELENSKVKKSVIKWSTIGSIVLFIIIGVGMTGCPVYKVWQQEMEGKAEMARAEQNRQILIEEAKANLEAQKLNSEAEVERAKGMAQAIEIENGKLTEKYIQYLWVRNIETFQGAKIYIPTEANLPILEAKK
jgi:regulator of protease activity HflC (stomatin/prohibitin superfamily)